MLNAIVFRVASDLDITMGRQQPGLTPWFVGRVCPGSPDIDCPAPLRISDIAANGRGR